MAERIAVDDLALIAFGPLGALRSAFAGLAFLPSLPWRPHRTRLGQVVEFDQQLTTHALEEGEQVSLAAF